MERRTLLQRPKRYLYTPPGVVLRRDPFFPPLNGVFAKKELPEDESTAADYSLGTQMIYIAFAWSKAELAYQTTLDLAAKHDLGFFNISSQDEEVWLPAEGRLILAHQRGTTS